MSWRRNACTLTPAIGVVSQDAHLFHDTIRANLVYARPEATEDQLWAALTGARIAALVASLPDGLETVVGDRGFGTAANDQAMEALGVKRVGLQRTGTPGKARLALERTRRFRRTRRPWTRWSRWPRWARTGWSRRRMARRRPPRLFQRSPVG